MAVSPIKAHCSRCRQSFHLFELLEERSGRCPRCGWALTQDWVHELLRHARGADIAQRQLIAALRGLRSLPGNVALRPHTVLRNLFEEVGWDRDLIDDPALLREEIVEIRRLLAAWELLDPQVADAQPRRSWLRRSIDALLGRRPDVVLPPVGAPDLPTPAADLSAVTTNQEPSDIAA